MYKVGVYPGKFTPPHRGHLAAILEASCQCEKFYVLVSHNAALEKPLYEGTNTKPISLKQKTKWLSIELEDFAHIKVIGSDEGDIPGYPEGWRQWAELVKKTIPEPFDAIFGGEPEYAEEGYTAYFPGVKYVIHDRNKLYPISATEIRRNPYKHWDYILGSAREHFVKRVLITGTESCGKTTLTKMLAKIFFTSWAREEGRYYSEKYFGRNETVYELDDFLQISWEHRQVENHATRTANKIVFIDTDAVVTQYYCQMYMGKENPKIESLIEPNRYDLILLMNPDVKWVADGLRFSGEQEQRIALHERLRRMYQDRGFENIIEICGGDYQERLQKAMEISNSLINGELK